METNPNFLQLVNKNIIPKLVTISCTKLISILQNYKRPTKEDLYSFWFLTFSENDFPIFPGYQVIYYIWSTMFHNDTLFKKIKECVKIENYKSHTPIKESLNKYSFIFLDGYSNNNTIGKYNLERLLDILKYALFNLEQEIKTKKKTPKAKILKHWFFNISSAILQVIPFSPFNHIGDTTLEKWYSMHDPMCKLPNTYSIKPNLVKIIRTINYLMECAKQNIRALDKHQDNAYHK